MAAWRVARREMLGEAVPTAIKLGMIRTPAAAGPATAEPAVPAAIAGTVRSVSEVWVALHFLRPSGVLDWVAAAGVVRATIQMATIRRAAVAPGAASFSFAPEALREPRR